MHFNKNNNFTSGAAAQENWLKRCSKFFGAILMRFLTEKLGATFSWIRWWWEYALVF